MAISKETSDLIGLITDDNERSQVLAIAEKFPAFDKAIKEGTLRQSDYDRRMNEQKAEHAESQRKLQLEIKRYEDAHNGNVQWREQNLKKFNDALNENSRLKQQIENAARSATNEGGEVTAAEVEKAVQAEIAKSGMPKTPEELQALINKTAEGLTKDFNENTLPAMTQFTLDMVDIGHNHWNEFGKPLDRQALADYMKNNQINDPKRAYNEMVAKDRHDKELEAERKRIEAEVRETIKKETSHNVPGTEATAATGATGVGAVQMRVAQAAAAAQGAGAPGGAAAAAAELRAEGKGVQ